MTVQWHDPARNIVTLAGAGLELAQPQDIAEAHALVERLVGPPLASADVMRRIQDRTKASIFVVRQEGRITGVVGELALTPEGMQALTSGAFNGIDPDLAHVAAPGQAVAAFYCWGIAADTRKAAATTIRGVVTAREAVYADLPFFTRAAPPRDGGDDAASRGARSAFRRFDCVYYPGQPTLVYSPTSAKSGRAAA
jgi:hypothetical protein